MFIIRAGVDPVDACINSAPSLPKYSRSRPLVVMMLPVGGVVGRIRGLGLEYLGRQEELVYKLLPCA